MVEKPSSAEVHSFTSYITEIKYTFQIPTLCKKKMQLQGEMYNVAVELLLSLIMIFLILSIFCFLE